MTEFPQQRAGFIDCGALGRPTGAISSGGTLVLRTIRSRRGVCLSAATNPPSGPGSDVVTSKNNAASSTVRVSGPLEFRPYQPSS